MGHSLILCSDEKKLEEALKKLNVQPINQVEEVNMFQNDGRIIHFTRPQGNDETCPCLENCFSSPGFGFIHSHMKA